MNDITRKIDLLLKIANETAIEWLENHLKEMMKDNSKKIDMIINRMGVTAFYLKGEPLSYDDCKKLKGGGELFDFMSNYDDIFCLTGHDIEIKK